jgi:hypothetical protein
MKTTIVMGQVALALFTMPASYLQSDLTWKYMQPWQEKEIVKLREII